MVESAGPEGEGVGPFDVLLGFAGLEEGEREGVRRRERLMEGMRRCELQHFNGVRIAGGG